MNKKEFFAGMGINLVISAINSYIWYKVGRIKQRNEDIENETYMVERQTETLEQALKRWGW